VRIAGSGVPVHGGCPGPLGSSRPRYRRPWESRYPSSFRAVAGCRGPRQNSIHGRPTVPPLQRVDRTGWGAAKRSVLWGRRLHRIDRPL